MRAAILGVAIASAVVAGSVSGWVDFTAWGPDDWSALAACVTAAVAVAVGVVAWYQLGEARRLRLEQAQPYVVAFMESTTHHQGGHIDLVVRNFGSTGALIVKIQIEPAPQRSGNDLGTYQDVAVPNEIPVLVPGQEWRTWWDTAPGRAKTNLPDKYQAVVTYQDSQGRALPRTPSVLDWTTNAGSMYITTYGLHHAAEALRELNKTTKRWKEDLHGGLAVFVRDGDAKDQRRRAERDAWSVEEARSSQASDDDPKI